MPMSMEFNSATRLSDLNECYRELYAVDSGILEHRKKLRELEAKLKELETKRFKIATEIADYTAGKK